MLRVLDLFSGIGGFSLGLERAGMKTVAFCEIDPYCRRVLAKHWPEVPCYDDVTTAEFTEGQADVVCGGFPCQDISFAGGGAGLAGERSGLFRELVRAIRVVRPKFALLENVAALLGRGMGTVLGDLAEIGHDAEWHCIPASAVGAPHRRDRVWIVAHPGSAERWPLGGACGRVARTERVPQGQEGPGGSEPGDQALAYPDDQRTAQSPRCQRESRLGPIIGGEMLADANGQRCEVGRDDAGSEGEARGSSPRREAFQRDWWLTEPDVGRVAHGVPARVDRLKGLGNAVVPQIPELIGRAILAAEASP